MTQREDELLAENQQLKLAEETAFNAAREWKEQFGRTESPLKYTDFAHYKTINK